MRKSIRIKTVSQCYLLNQLDGCFGKRKIPKEVIGRIYYILSSKKLGKNGFVVLCIPKIYDDFAGLEEAADMYPYQIYWYEKMDEITVITRNRTKSWYISYGRVKGQNTKVAVIYQTKACE